MKCNETGKMIIDRLAGELSAIQTRVLDKHLDSCEACRKEFEILSKVWQSGRATLAQDTFAKELSKNRRAEIFAVAAKEKKASPESIVFTRILGYATLALAVCFILAGLLLPSLSRSNVSNTLGGTSYLPPAKQEELERRMKKIERADKGIKYNQESSPQIALAAPPPKDSLQVHAILEEVPAEKSKRRGRANTLGDDASEVAAEYDQLVKESAGGGKREKSAWTDAINLDRPSRKAGTKRFAAATAPPMAAQSASDRKISRLKQLEKEYKSLPAPVVQADSYGGTMFKKMPSPSRSGPADSSGEGSGYTVITGCTSIPPEVSPRQEMTKPVKQKTEAISKLDAKKKNILYLDGRVNAPVSAGGGGFDTPMVVYSKISPVARKSFKLDLKLWNMTTPANVRKYLLENRYPAPDAPRIEIDRRRNTITIEDQKTVLSKIEKFFEKLQEEEKELKDFSSGLPFIKCSSRPVSTFSIDTDTASYVQARKGIRRGERPDPLKVRPEEFINYFDYNYRSPQNATFAVYPEAVPSPFRPNNTLFRVGIQGKRLGPGSGTRTHYTILLDISGSMAVKDRMDLAKKALAMMLKKLQPSDYVSLLLCGNTTSTLVKGKVLNDYNRKRLLSALEKVNPQGVADFAAGISAAYNFAGRTFLSNGSNRIVIISDGIFELSPEGKRNISAQIEAARKRGISNIVIGLGGDGDDDTLEKIAAIGDGSYVFLDSEREAEELFTEQFEARFREIARDVKIQVEFNKDAVNSYRQIGYHNRQLSEADFRNDKVDAGEVGSGQSVTALYELKLKNDIPKDMVVATIRIRYKKAEDMSIEEKAFYLYESDIKDKFEDSTANFKLAAYVAEFAEALRYPETRDIASLRGIADKLNTLWMNDYRKNRKVTELLSLIRRCK
jgi:Ca-activated chloride channel family protein